jgi:RNA polymerase sigma-70 factor (ECF subfamily)
MDVRMAAGSTSRRRVADRDAGAVATGGAPRAEPTSDLGSADDAVVAARAADGDVRAFEVLVRRYSRLMHVYSRSILGSNSDVDDVVQESFVVAWQQLADLENPAAVRGWLMRIVGRRSLDHLRRRRPSAVVDDEQLAAHGASPVETAESKGFEQAVENALARLPVDQQRCWVLKTVGELSYREIARELELPESTVRGLLARARKFLTIEMEEWR